MNSTCAIPMPTSFTGAALAAPGVPEPETHTTARWAHAWTRVLARDGAADGSFVYAVQSTGIFCRPSCPSRRPERERVAFYETVAEAMRAGYRACLRCRPEQVETAERARDREVIATVLRVAEGTDGERLDLRALSRAAGTSPSSIRKAFARGLGTTPARYLRERRLREFREAMSPEGSSPGAAPRITDALYDAGFGSSSRLYEDSGARFGMTPSALRAGGPGERIDYLLTASPLGRTLVAATGRGVCAIHFADTDELLRAELARRFPQATLVEQSALSPAAEAKESEGTGSHWLPAAVAFVLSQLSESPAAAGFPLDVRATAFQERVWQALRGVPRGTRVSYGALARQLGEPTAARAVASACAQNPIALAIPCHRVVGAGGALTGYRWGVERKRTLLETEQHQGIGAT